jgi:hypothetical protein
MRSDMATAERYGLACHDGRSMVAGLRAGGAPGLLMAADVLAGRAIVPPPLVDPREVEVGRAAARIIRQAYAGEAVAAWAANPGVVIV